mgnify:CR=1 FL=1
MISGRNCPMSKRLMLPGVLVLSGIVLRFFFTGVGYIAYAMFFAAALIAIMRFCKRAWIKLLPRSENPSIIR